MNIDFQENDAIILMEERFVYQNPLPAIGFQCQNLLPKDLYYYYL